MRFCTPHHSSDHTYVDNHLKLYVLVFSQETGPLLGTLSHIICCNHFNFLLLYIFCKFHILPFFWTFFYHAPFFIYPSIILSFDSQAVLKKQCTSMTAISEHYIFALSSTCSITYNLLMKISFSFVPMFLLILAAPDSQYGQRNYLNTSLYIWISTYKKNELHVIPKLCVDIHKVHRRHVILAYCSNSLCPHALYQG